ncbi:MAG TPA: hypothetical protein VF384_15720 [Planctomycetota bacterium]
MNKLSILTPIVMLGSVLPVVAQTCATPPSQMTFSNRDEFVGSFYYNMGAHFADVTTQRDISISQIRTWTYDQGAGLPPVPSQVGNQGVVNVYTCPTTRLGNETTSPSAPASPWTLLGSGTITIQAQPTESAVVFTPPLTLLAGTYGIAIEYLAPTTGTNPGPLHCLGKSPNPGGVVSDQFISWSNDGIQGTAFVGGVTASPNLRVVYTADPGSAHWKKTGEGCYFRPHAFYEDFPASATAPDVANTSQLWIWTGANYVVTPAAAVYTPPTTPSLTTSPPAFGSSPAPGLWDDALSAPITLPFPMNYPGGSTTEITISSNGGIYLANVGNNTYETCGACYGAISSFRDQPARIAGFFHDLDPSSGGGIHYETGPTFWRVTFAAVPEWPVPTALNTIQITVDNNHNVELIYGALANTGVINGNNAILGFTPGNGSMLPPPIDFSTAMPFPSGDGQIPPILKLDARPVIGQPFNFVTTNIAPGTPFQLLTIGDTLTPIPIDLGFLGMPGCSLHHGPIAILTVTGLGPDLVYPFAIPPVPAYFNAQLTAQGFPFALALNPFNLLATNGVCMRIGN